MQSRRMQRQSLTLKWFTGVGLFFLLQMTPLDLAGQEAVGWEALADVTFKEQFDKEIGGYWLVPSFGPNTKAWEGKVITLEGYFIPIDMQENFHVLSMYPFANCFFCGAAGPESIVEIQIDKNAAKRTKMDQRIRVEGKLVLNNTDFYHCSYILKNAKIIQNQK